MHALPGTHVSCYDKQDTLLDIACVFSLLCSAGLIHNGMSFDSYILSRLLIVGWSSGEGPEEKPGRQEAPKGLIVGRS